MILIKLFSKKKRVHCFHLLVSCEYGMDAIGLATFCERMDYTGRNKQNFESSTLTMILFVQGSDLQENC